MIDDLILPGTVRYSWLVVVFLAGLMVFHVLFIKLRPLDRIGWKKIDYAWLSCAFLGITGSVAFARQMLAEGMKALGQARLDLVATDVRELVRWLPAEINLRHGGDAPSGLMEAYDRAYAAHYVWLVQAISSIENAMAAGVELNYDVLFGRPPSHESWTEWARERSIDAFDRYNVVQGAVTDLAIASVRSDLEVWMAVYGPFLLAAALALRITKVTGEIRLENTARREALDAQQRRIAREDEA